jgi:hypothetical protein
MLAQSRSYRAKQPKTNDTQNRASQKNTGGGKTM